MAGEALLCRLRPFSDEAAHGKTLLQWIKLESGNWKS